MNWRYWFLLHFLIVICCLRCASHKDEKATATASVLFEQLISKAQDLAQKGQVDSSSHCFLTAYMLADSVGLESRVSMAAGFLGNHYLHEKGDINAAQTYLTIERDILEDNTKHNVQQLIRNYLDLSFLRVKKLDLPYALSYVMMAFDLAQAHVLSDSSLWVDLYIGLGHVHYHMTDYDQAIDDYSFAMRLVARHPELRYMRNRIALGFINCYNNRGDTLRADVDSALDWLEKYRLMNLSDTMALAEYESLLGIHHYLNSEYKKSITHLLRATEFYRHDRSPNPYNHLNAFLVLSAAYQFDSLYEEALRAVDSTLILTFGIDYGFDDLRSDIRCIVPYASKAEILADIGMRNKSIPQISTAIDMYESLDSLIRYFIKHDTESYLHHQFYNNFYYYKRIQICAFAYGKSHDQKWLHSMHDLITKYKAQSFLRDRVLNTLFHSEARKYQSVRDYVANDLDLEAAYFLSQDTAHKLDYSIYNEINTLLRERERIISAMQVEAPQVLDTWTNVKNISADSLLDFTVANRTPVLNYYIGNIFYNKDNIYVLSAVLGEFKLDIIKHSSQIFVLVDSIYQIHSSIAMQQTPIDTAWYYSLSHALYQKLVEPTLNNLNNVSNFVVIPDQKLHLLAFDALVTNDPATHVNVPFKPDYLITQKNVTYTFSPNSLIKPLANRPDSHTIDILAMGFSDVQTYGESKVDEPPELRSSINELNIIEKYRGTKTVRLFRGQDCTKKNFFKHAQKAACIHLSTHGAYDPQNRYSSMLYMRGPSGIEELYQHELRYKNISPGLLVLSACESGAGMLSNEEGMFSVGRAFQAAGTQCVVSALWPLSDRASSKAFGYFYEQLFTGSSVSSALRFTKQQMIRQQNQYSFPAYWSSLIVHE